MAGFILLIWNANMDQNIKLNSGMIIPGRKEKKVLYIKIEGTDSTE